LPLNNKILIHSLYANGMSRFPWLKSSEKTRLGSTLTGPEVRLGEIAFDSTRHRPTQFWANGEQTGSNASGLADYGLPMFHKVHCLKGRR